MSDDKPCNFHATAIVVGTTGIMFTGKPGGGKSSMAMAFLAAANQRGLLARLVADDQVLLSRHNGRIIAARPASIDGLIEIRGSGIGHFASISHAVMHCAIAPYHSGSTDRPERMPPDNERLPLPCGGDLPLLNIALELPDPLAVFMAIFPPGPPTMAQREQKQQF